MTEHLADLGIDPEAGGADDPTWLVALKLMRFIGFILAILGLVARKLKYG